MSLVSSLLAGVLVVAQTASSQTVASEAPAEVFPALIAVERPLSFAGECTELHPKLGLVDDFQRLQSEYDALSTDAQGIWPSLDLAMVEVAAAQGGRPWTSCNRKNVGAALQQAK